MKASVFFTGLIGISLCALMVLNVDAKVAAEFDTDIQILYRPKYKKILDDPNKNSGYCCVTFDVDETGATKNIDVNFCTSENIGNGVENRIRQYLFSPAKKDGRPVVRTGATLTPSVVNYDRETGMPISSKGGFLSKRYESKQVPPKPKSRSEKKDWLNKYFKTEMHCSISNA